MRPELGEEAMRFAEEPRPALTLLAAEPVSMPADSLEMNGRSTVSAIAIVPGSERPSEEEPLQREPLLVDDRVDGLLREIFVLTKERKDLYEISNVRIRRANECLEMAREAKRLVRDALREADDIAGKLGTDAFGDAPALAKLRAWAAKPI